MESGGGGGIAGTAERTCRLDDGRDVSAVRDGAAGRSGVTEAAIYATFLPSISTTSSHFAGSFACLPWTRETAPIARS